MITETNCTDFLETPITLLMKRGVLLLITFYYTYSTSFFLFKPYFILVASLWAELQTRKRQLPPFQF